MSSISLAQQRARQRANFIIFLGPACVLLLLFFILPVVVDIAVAFTDMGRTLRIEHFTYENFERMFTRDSRLIKSLGLTFIYVLATLAFFNVTFGLLLALATTAAPDRVGSFFRAVWL
ncbi:MAG: carbohydrate ABC transporter permease, partial [Hyphomicrobiaceae bacterium]